MNKYKITLLRGSVVDSHEIQADLFKVTKCGALAFYSRPDQSKAHAAFNADRWLTVERVPNVKEEGE